MIDNIQFDPDRPVTLRGRVFEDWDSDGTDDEDLDGDGTPDTKAKYLNGWTVHVIDPNQVLIATAQTQDIDLDGDGKKEAGVYEFTDLFPDAYTVELVMPAKGFELTFPTTQKHELPFLEGTTRTGNAPPDPLVFGVQPLHDRGGF